MNVAVASRTGVSETAHQIVGVVSLEGVDLIQGIVRLDAGHAVAFREPHFAESLEKSVLQ